MLPVTIRNLLLALLLALGMSGCVGYQSLQSNERAGVGAQLDVQVVGQWASFAPRFTPFEGPSAVWTVDGLSLNMLLFFDGIEAGEPVLRHRQSRSEHNPPPVYKKGMTETDVMELIESSLARMPGNALVRARDLRPFSFAGTPGFAFDLDLVDENQLEIHALAIGGQREGKLYLLLYRAPKMYFYDREAGSVQAIAESASIKSS